MYALQIKYYTTQIENKEFEWKMYNANEILRNTNKKERIAIQMGNIKHTRLFVLQYK